MELFEVIILVLGILVIIGSFFLKVGDENKETSELEVLDLPSIDAYKSEMAHVEEAMKARVDAYCKEAMMLVEEKVCKLSNEKILALDETARGTLDQIKQNHSEVVFLYSMLHEKEEKINSTTLPNEEEVEERVTLNLQEEDPVQRRDKILSLYNRGETVRDISKRLDIGQGEVQLVVKLFTGGQA